MIHAVNVFFGKNLVYFLVNLLGGMQTVPKRLFIKHPFPFIIFGIHQPHRRQIPGGILKMFRQSGQIK